MKHKIKNINPAEKTLPAYDGTDRFIKLGEIIEVDVTEKVQYMINNGFFEYLGEVDSSEEDVNKALKNIDEEQEDFFPKDEAEREEQKKAIKEDYAPKPHKKKGKTKKRKKYTEDD